jgi:hypothetical protein
VFATDVIAATLMILKAMSMSWLTVVRMMQVKGGLGKRRACLCAAIPAKGRQPHGVP